MRALGEARYRPPVQVIELAPERIEELRAFLAKDPVQNLYALGALEEHGLAVGVDAPVGAFALLDEGRVIGAVVLGGRGGITMPCVFDPGAAAELGRYLVGQVRIRSVLGERSAVDALARAAGCGPARWSRPQRLFAASADDLGPFVCSGLRSAVPSDVPDLLQMTIASIKESTGEDPVAGGSAVLSRRVEARVAAGRTYVLSEGGRLIVKIDVGVRSRHGAELEGLFTVPNDRHKGHATNVLGQLSRMLLSSIKHVTMRVEEKDNAIAAVCRKVGLTAMRPQRLLVIG
ncbi:MAG: DUF4081 domain-containing protein [Deltaproteobacteria bacterium]|nr:DUF4081 domain-containing protein [Deltaproteobacteria bacterium]